MAVNFLLFLHYSYDAGSSEHNNEPSGSIKVGELIGQLNNYQLHKHSAV